MLDIKIMFGTFLFFGGFALMVSDIDLAPYAGLGIMAIGFYLLLLSKSLKHPCS